MNVQQDGDRMQSAVCDECRKPFFITKTQKKYFKDEKAGTVVIHYFECPHCKAKYPFHAETDEIKKLIKKQKKLREKIPQAILDDKLEEQRLKNIYKEMDELKNKVKSLQAEYKALFKLDE